MRFGGFLSLVAHVAIVAMGMIVAPTVASGGEMMPIIDIDLVTLSDETNVAPVTEKAKEDDKAEEAQQEEFASAAPPPPPKPEDTVALDEPEAKPPPKPKEKSAADELAGILSAIPDKKPQPARTSAATKATNLNNIPDAGSRQGYGRRTANTATIAAIITSQLITKRCWTDHSDMPDAHRLSTTIRVRFGRNGTFLEDPKMIEPSRPPNSDQPLQVYIQHAFTALTRCNSYGFTVPPEYFDLPTKDQYLDLVLLPNVAKMQ